jgi:hypothetical protein
MTMPIFIIACHGTICPTYEECGYPPSIENKNPPTFFLDENTILLNPSAGGEVLYSCFTDIQDLVNNPMLIRTVSVVTDKADLQSVTMNSEKEYGVPISSFMRASNSEYPNILCDFDSGGDKSMLMGVVEMVDGGLVKYVINPKKSAQKGLLRDIIRETYRIANVSSGIFIFIGCTSAFYFPQTKSHAVAFSKISDNASLLIREADLNYNSLVATTDISNIDMRPFYKQPYFGEVIPNSSTLLGDAIAHDDTVANIYPNLFKYKYFKNVLDEAQAAETAIEPPT